MSDIITAYPTAGLSDRSLNSINNILYEYMKSIPAVSDFFDSIELLDGTQYYDIGIKFTKGSSYIYKYNSGRGEEGFCLNNHGDSSPSNRSNLTNPATSNDIAVSYATGISGTTVIWLDQFSKDACMIFNQFDDKVFIANSAYAPNYSLYYSDSGNTVYNLPNPFNGNNIGSGGDYIAQPYYHKGIHTGDIYTFDGGSGNIPWGKFKLGDSAEFIRITSNFALKLK